MDDCREFIVRARLPLSRVRSSLNDSKSAVPLLDMQSAHVTTVGRFVVGAQLLQAFFCCQSAELSACIWRPRVVADCVVKGVSFYPCIIVAELRCPAKKSCVVR